MQGCHVGAARLGAMGLCALAWVAATQVQALTLPATLRASGPGPGPTRPWTEPDIVEVTRIESTAVDDAGRTAAFVLRQPSIADDGDRYGLYLAALGGAGARKVLDARYLGDLQARPLGRGWTLRADVGHGVQLYGVDEAGRLTPLVVRPTVPVGGADGIASSADEPRRETGVIAYGWNRDGSAFWYLNAVPIAPGDADNPNLKGVVYDPALAMPADFYSEVRAAALELRVADAASGQDLRIAAWPGSRGLAERIVQPGRIAWSDNNILVYAMPFLEARGVVERTGRFDRRSGRADLEPPGAPGPTAAPLNAGALAPVRSATGDWSLRRIDDAGRMLEDLGPVDFSALGGALGAWRGEDGRAIFGALYRDRFGLFSYPASEAGQRLATTPVDLSHCSFDRSLSIGVCSEQSLTQAPRLVAVRLRTGEIRPLADPNTRYQSIAPLRSEVFTWTNSRGHPGWGYVTYPRDFRPDRRYPTLLVTHAADARNRFADEAFQWDFPLQVFAEHGYLVLSVNERTIDTAALSALSGADVAVPVARLQDAAALEAVANMEAAARVWIDRGSADPLALGIAGYSRGGIVTMLTLSQSSMFRAGISADTGFYNASGYWRGDLVRRLYERLYGGSPFDPVAIGNYRALSPSLRAGDFSGPLMQLFTGDVAPAGLELDTALREARTPTELVAFVGETHAFHRPLSKLSAMARSSDWFDFWLKHQVDPAPDKADQYRRWRDMAARWPRGSLTQSGDAPGHR